MCGVRLCNSARVRVCVCEAGDMEMSEAQDK